MVSLLTLPTLILIEVLKKLNFVPYFRIRRTCTYIYEFVLKEQNRFRISYSGLTLDIKFNPKAKSRLKFCLRNTVEEEDGYLHYEYRNITKTVSTLLAGLVFDYVFFIPLKHMYYLAEDWVSFKNDMRNVSKTTTLKCKNLQIGARFKHFPTIAQFFQTTWVSTLTHEWMEEGDRSDTTELPSSDYALAIIEKPGMDNVTCLSLQTEGRYEALVPIAKRMKCLDWREHEYYYNLSEETPKNVNLLFREIIRGSFDHQTKHVELNYESKTEFYRTENNWKPFEFQNIPHTVIRQELNDHSKSSLLLIETNGSTTICRTDMGSRGGEYIAVHVKFFLLPTFNPREVSLFIIGNLSSPRSPINGAVLLKLVEKREWHAVAETIESINERAKSNRQCLEEEEDDDN